MFDLDSTVPRREIPSTDIMAAQCRPSILGMPLRAANIVKVTHQVHRLLPFRPVNHPEMKVPIPVPGSFLTERSPRQDRTENRSHFYRGEPRTGTHYRRYKDLAQRDGFPGPYPSFCEIWDRCCTNSKPLDSRWEPQLTKFLRLSPLVTFLPVICPLQPCRVSSMLRYRRSPAKCTKVWNQYREISILRRS